MEVTIPSKKLISVLLITFAILLTIVAFMGDGVTIAIALIVDLALATRIRQLNKPTKAFINGK